MPQKLLTTTRFNRCCTPPHSQKPRRNYTRTTECQKLQGPTKHGELGTKNQTYQTRRTKNQIPRHKNPHLPPSATAGSTFHFCPNPVFRLPLTQNGSYLRVRPRIRQQQPNGVMTRAADCKSATNHSTKPAPLIKSPGNFSVSRGFFFISWLSHFGVLGAIRYV